MIQTQDISNLTLLELKALVYDLLEERARLEQNLITVRREIETKLAESKEESKTGAGTPAQ